MTAPGPKGTITMVWFTLGGMALGFLLVHPFAMMAYTLGPQHAGLSMDPSFWGRELRLAFASGMVHMGLAFTFLGGLTGGSLGAWFVQKERLAAARLESQRRLAALETLQELMVTLAHHIRNANVVIGGFSARLLKRLSDPELQEQLRLIQHASQEIEAVIASLQSLAEIDHTRYVAAWQTQMIDLKQELAVRLESAEALKESHEP